MNTSNTTNTTNNTIANPTTMTTADNEAQDSNLQQKEQLQLMIDGEKWDAIVQLLKWEEQKSQKQNTTAIKLNSFLHVSLYLSRHPANHARQTPRRTVPNFLRNLRPLPPRERSPPK